MEIKEEVLSEELQRANISLILSSYNDIFSSFDARPFAEKSLSDDFLIECKRAVRDKDEFGLELILSIPKDKRNLNDEFKIKKRLRDHFHRHWLEKEREIDSIKREGLIWVILGSLLIIGLVYGLVIVSSTLFESILTILEVPGWFLVWEGMDKIFVDSRKLKADYVFYKKMASAYITFRSY